MRKSFSLLNRTFTAVFLTALLVFAGGVPDRVFGNGAAFQTSFASVREKWIRTDLFFGMGRADGQPVSEEEWQHFVDDVISARFPDGFTVLSGSGQYREANGKVVKEPCKVLVVIYKRSSRVATDKKIEEIRAEYKRRFSQESVLRIDSKSLERVLF